MSHVVHESSQKGTLYSVHAVWRRRNLPHSAAFAWFFQVTACLLAQNADAGPTKSRRSLAHHSVQTGGGGRIGIVRSSNVSSKLTSGKWPRPKGVANKIVRILRQWGALRQQQQQQQPQQQKHQPKQTSIGIPERGGQAERSDADGKHGRSEGTHERAPAVWQPPQTLSSNGDSAARAVTRCEIFDIATARGSSDEPRREGKDTQHSAGNNLSVPGEKAASAAAVRTEPVEGGVSRCEEHKPDATGCAADNTGKGEAVPGGKGVTRTETVQQYFSLSVEDAFVEVRNADRAELNRPTK